ncbi:unnamed protein product [Schistocephalus solidus]|uniref:G_PROTEIN_RECEP_F1_2 domain-containing protein n=1 Tax=Schistocephalus solidus TaxID=70667 RepID=A0A183SMK5_SCHSO|nr:unnamed protein product [Schistocephalus solidus]
MILCSEETWPGGPTIEAFLDYNRFAFLSVIGLPVCAVGVVTSALSICLFCRDRTTPRTTRKILIVTSLVDAQFLLFSMLYLQPFIFCREGCAWRRFYKSLAYLLPIFSLVNILESLRNWLVVLIGVERFLVVCFPVRSKLWWNGKIANCLIAVCFGLSVLVRLPLISYLIVDNAGVESSWVAALLYQMHLCIDSIMVTLIPLIILIVCSLRIGRGLRRSDHFRQGQTGQQQGTGLSESHRESTSSAGSVVRRVKLTRALLIVLVTFTLFTLPLVPVSIIQIVLDNFFPSSCVYLVALHICSYVAALGSQLNSTANFFVYIFYWDRSLTPTSVYVMFTPFPKNYPLTFNSDFSCVSHISRNICLLLQPVASPSQLQYPQHGMDAQDSGPLLDFRVRDPVLPAQLQYSAEADEMEVIQLPGFVRVEGSGLCSEKKCRQDDGLVHLQFGVQLPLELSKRERIFQTAGELVSPKRQAEAHQAIIDTLRQTGQTSHDVVPDGKDNTSVASLCLWPAAPEESVAGPYLLQLTLLRESGLSKRERTFQAASVSGLTQAALRVRESDIPDVEAHAIPETLNCFIPPVMTFAQDFATGKRPNSRSHRTVSAGILTLMDPTPSTASLHVGTKTYLPTSGDDEIGRSIFPKSLTPHFRQNFLPQLPCGHWY